MNCPKCGNKLELTPHPDKPGRVQGFCKCNPYGPVLETNAPKPTKPMQPHKED